MTEDAYTFAVRMCRRRGFRAEPWPPGLMIDVARVAGIEFGDDRHWGGVFLRLAKDGYIKRAGLFARESSNGSVRPGWIAC
jgi:hypothetical protein